MSVVWQSLEETLEVRDFFAGGLRYAPIAPRRDGRRLRLAWGGVGTGVETERLRVFWDLA